MDDVKTSRTDREAAMRRLYRDESRWADDDRKFIESGDVIYAAPYAVGVARQIATVRIAREEGYAEGVKAARSEVRSSKATFCGARGCMGFCDRCVALKHADERIARLTRPAATPGGEGEPMGGEKRGEIVEAQLIYASPDYVRQVVETNQQLRAALAKAHAAIGGRHSHGPEGDAACLIDAIASLMESSKENSLAEAAATERAEAAERAIASLNEYVERWRRDLGAHGANPADGPHASREDIGEAIDRVVAERDEARHKASNYLCELKRSNEERDEARRERGVAFAKDVWHWQTGKDGSLTGVTPLDPVGNEVESLTCPVVMSAETCRKLLARIADGDRLADAYLAARPDRSGR